MNASREPPPSLENSTSLDQVVAAWNKIAATCTGIDPWCSTTVWQCSVDDAFGDRPIDVSDVANVGDGAPTEDAHEGHRFDDTGLQAGKRERNARDYVCALDNQSAALFRRRPIGNDRVALLPLDAVWGFAPPIVANTNASNRRLHQIRTELERSSWDTAFITGLVENGALETAILSTFADRFSLYAGPSTTRCVASLDGGLDGFLSRRTRTFRRNLRQAQRRAKQEQVSVEVADLLDERTLFGRLHGVERESWKGNEGSGIESSDMDLLYRLVTRRLRSAGHVRVAFAIRDGIDVGFILGGVIGSRYRGLQISYAESARSLSIGSLLQLHEIARLCDEGVRDYDLGMEMDYKRDWSENELVTRAIVAIR